MRHGSYALGQVAVGAGVLRFRTAYEWNDVARVDVVEPLDDGIGGCRQLHHAEHSALGEHAMHLGIALLEVLKVAHAVSHGHGIEFALGKAKVQTVAFFEGDGVVEVLLSYLAATYFEHTGAEVDAHYLLRLECAAQLYGKVAGAGGYIEQALWVVLGNEAHSLTAPPLVDAHGHASVHKVVGGRYRVEHLAHLAGFALDVVVGIDFFCLILHRARIV